MEPNLVDNRAACGLDCLNDGDRIAVHFSPPIHEPDCGAISEATGLVRVIVNRHFLIVENHRKAWQMPPCIDLPADNIRSIRMLESAGEIRDRKSREAREAIVHPDLPRDSTELIEQLEC